MLVKVYTYWKRLPKKTFEGKKVNILITGGVQGIGRLLTAKFALLHAENDLTLIVVDIAASLEPELRATVDKVVGKPFKRLYFYSCDLSEEEETKKLWNKLVLTHGPINILINNAARVLGRNVNEMSLATIKKTMDINFHAYV